MVVAGQGTVAKEIDEQVEGVEVIYCAIGGGGLIGGMGAWFKATRPGV